MQTVMMQNESLEKDIVELQRKIQELQNSGVMKPKTYTRKKSIFTLGRKKKKDAALVGVTVDKRSQKILKLITEIHEMILSGNFQRAQQLVSTNKKKLFPPKNGVPVKPKPYDLKDGFGETVLMKAVRQANREAVEQLVDFGASCDVPDNDGETPLMIASKYGQVGIVELLVSGANKDAHTKYTKKTALIMAAESGHEKVCEILLNNGADPHAEDVDGRTAMDLAKNKSVFKLIRRVMKKQGVEERIQMSGADDMSDDGLMELEDMHEDNSEDEEELAELLGDEYDPFKASKKRTYSEDEEMKKLQDKNKELQDKKQQLEIVFNDAKLKRGPGDKWNEFRTLNADERKKLLDGDGRKKKEVHAIEKFHALVLLGDTGDAIDEIEKILVDKKLKVVKDKPDAYGETGLMKAARLGFDTMLDLLIQYKCDFDGRDNNGYSPAMKAAEFGRLSTLRKLVEEGANLDFATRRNKYTALMLAAQRGHADICKELINEGANYNLQDTAGNTAIDLAVQEECKKVMKKAMEENPTTHNHNIQI